MDTSHLTLEKVRVDTNFDWSVGADIGTRPQVAQLLQIR